MRKFATEKGIKYAHVFMKDGSKVHTICRIAPKDKPKWVAIPEWKAHHAYLETKDTSFSPVNGIIYRKWETKAFTNTAWLVPVDNILGVE